MFNKLIKAIKLERLLKSQQDSSQDTDSIIPSVPISGRLEDNKAAIKNLFDNSSDIALREFFIGSDKRLKAFICFVEGLEDKTLINDNVIRPLMRKEIRETIKDTNSHEDILIMIKNCIVNTSELSEGSNMDIVLDGILSGSVAIFIEGCTTAIIANTIDIKTRSIEEPSTEALVRGPREGFVESININTSLIRRKIKNPNLKFESLKLGKQTRTKVSICYIRGIANAELVEEVRRRLKLIKIDSILESGYIEQFITDNPSTPFPTIGNSERPDKIVGKLLEGRIAILCDGTPFVLTVPFLFIESLQVSEDYYSHPFGVFFLRLIRIAALFATLFTPALYIALSTFHPEMVPAILLITAAASKEGTPFPTIIETIIMTTIFEVLRESGVRLPRQLGQALSIVGVLVIGESAVNAGIISSPMIIISALTGITGFIVVPLQDSVIIFRIFFIILSGIFGFYGLVLGTIAMVAHLCSLSSFGSPYLAPMAPMVWPDLKDSIIRLPLRLMKQRPKSINPEELQRQGSSVPNNEEKSGGEDN